jgi:ribosomal protein S18 acetylase RimI-like enzyme
VSPEVTEPGPDDWRLWRDLRLLSLRESPSAFGSTYDGEARFTEQTWRERLEDPGTVRLVALLGGRPVGLGGAVPDGPGRARVVSMWVLPEARGRGVVQVLLARLETWAAARGLRLHLDVTETNERARRSYERYGFRATGEVRPLRPDRTELVERMVLEEG